MTIAMAQLFSELDFEPFEHAFGGEGAFRFRTGPYRFEIVQLTNKWLRQSYFLSGSVVTDRDMACVETQLPMEVDSREEGLALLGYFVGQYVKEPHKTPWLRVAERLSDFLPWSRKDKSGRIFPNETACSPAQ